MDTMAYLLHAVLLRLGTHWLGKHKVSQNAYAHSSNSVVKELAAELLV